MFLRANRRTKDGKDHTYWPLVETARAADGPRQRTVCYLGQLNTSAAARWRKTIQLVNAQGEAVQLALFPADGAELPDDARIVRIRLDRVRWTRPREFGDGWLGGHLWQRVGVDAARVNTDRLYRCLDLLLPHKAALQQHLTARYGELFRAQYEVLLYDLTSTYVEGEAAGNPQMRRGYSRDHRPDCKQVVLALVVSPEGFPFAYEVFDGNRPDVTTVEEILDIVEATYGRAQRGWVFHRRLVSAQNLDTLRARQAQYLVGTPRAQLKAFERELL